MEIPHSAKMTTQEYSRCRHVLGLNRRQLAQELGVALSTITKRETTRGVVKREADLAMRWLVDHPPPKDTPVLALKAWMFKQGDVFGLFTIIDLVRRVGSTGRKGPRVLRVQCRCGRNKTVLAENFGPRYLCSTSCPAHLALLARGSHVDAYGDIIDKDGLPES